MDLKYKEKLQNDVVKLEEELWIPIHRMKQDEVERMTFDELYMYYNKLVVVRDNPV